MSGKPGRPPEDRLGRQQEIFLAVAPLIERYGARRLTMRQAAWAAHLSLGGLYHYFPTKQDLVLHALKPEAVARLCAEFHGRHADLERTDPGRYVQADVDYMARQCFFLRPAFQAASSWMPRLPGITSRQHRRRSGVMHQTAGPRAAGMHPEEIRGLGRSVRRTFFSALIDRTVTPDELRHELLSSSGAGPRRSASRPSGRLKVIALIQPRRSAS